MTLKLFLRIPEGRKKNLNHHHHHRRLVLTEQSLILIKVTAAVAVGRSQSETYLLRCGHEVDGGVVAVVFLRQAEGELVVDEKRVCLKQSSRRCGCGRAWWGLQRKKKKKKKRNSSISLVSKSHKYMFSERARGQDITHNSFSFSILKLYQLSEDLSVCCRCLCLQ